MDRMRMDLLCVCVCVCVCECVYADVVLANFSIFLCHCFKLLFASPDFQPDLVIQSLLNSSVIL